MIRNYDRDYGPEPLATAGDKEAERRVRDACADAAKTMQGLIPGNSPESELAHQRLQEAMMWGLAALRRQRFDRRTPA